MASFTHTFSPLKPSNLRIASTPLSPTTPHLTPPSPHRPSFPPPASPPLPPKNAHPAPPPPPQQWLWTCHLCHSRYPLAATRRCLHDGHLFCAGVAVSKRTGAVRKRVACSSEFDYVGWKAWGEWRRETQPHTCKRSAGKDCHDDCSYPSECRWGKKYGGESPEVKSRYVAFSPGAAAPAASKTGKSRSSAFLDRLIQSAGRKAAGARGGLSPVEEGNEDEEPEWRMQDQLQGLEFPMLSLEARDYENSPEEDTVMSDSESDSASDSDSDSDEGPRSIDATLYTPPRPERPRFLPHGMQSEESTTVERIIEYASADVGFSFAEASPSPTSPGRRGAWDWRIEVSDSDGFERGFGGGGAGVLGC